MKSLKILSKIAPPFINRKKLQEDTIDSEENYKDFFETVDDMLFVADSKGDILDCNIAAIDTLNYSKDDFKKMNLIDLHPEEKRQEATLLLGKMLSKDRKFCPIPFITKDGLIYPVESRVYKGKWDKEDCIYAVSKDLSKENQDFQIFSKMFEKNPLAMSINDIDERRFLKANPAFLEKIGYSKKEILHKKIDEIDLFEDIEKLKSIKLKKLNGQEVMGEEVTIKRKDGKILKCLLSIEDITIQGKEAFLMVIVDITEREELALKLERFFSINLDLLCILDLSGKFIKINKAWEDLLGFSSEEIEGKTFLEFIHPDDIKTTSEARYSLTEDIVVDKFINRYLCSDGKYHYIEWKANLYEDVIYAAARDVTDRIDYENKILEISNRDALTNVYNRRYIYKRAEEIIEEYKRNIQEFSICILDLDKFKLINDTYGHQVGDYVLKEFTHIIQENLRPYDLLGRYGGEEFILILKNIDLKASYKIVNRILEIIRETKFTYNEVDINFTFSAGIASSYEFDNQSITIDSLVKLADERMYKAKKAGRNKVLVN